MCRARSGTWAAKVQTWLLLNLLVVSPVFKHINRTSLRRQGCPAFSQLPSLRTGLNSTGLEVIAVHPGHMGSSSVALALEALGLRTYGASELFAYTTYLASEGPLPAYLVGALRACGVRAFNADDWYDRLPDLVAVSPGVKVIRLQREWTRWAPSASAMQLDILVTTLYHCAARFLLCNWLPYGLVWPTEGVGSSLLTPSTTAVLFSHCFRAVDDLIAAMPESRQFRMAKDRPFFEQTEFNVSKLVPPSRILDFDVKRHGWAELAAFLGREPPAGGTPFPKAKRSGQYRVLMYWALFPWQHIAFVALMALCACANWLSFRAAASLWTRCRGWLLGVARAKGA